MRKSMWLACLGLACLLIASPIWAEPPTPPSGSPGSSKPPKPPFFKPGHPNRPGGSNQAHRKKGPSDWDKLFGPDRGLSAGSPQYRQPSYRPRPGDVSAQGRRWDRRDNRNRWDDGGDVYVSTYSAGWPAYYGTSYTAGGRLHHSRNWRYVNVRGFDALGEFSGPSTDYRVKLSYDRVKSRDFPKALDDLAKGVFGALMAWPENPGLVAHSYALERLFSHLDMKVQAKLAYADDLSQATRMAYGQTLVHEVLAKLVEGITIEGDQYLVRFKLNNGKRSPWVVMPVIFLDRGLEAGGPVYRQGAYTYDGPYQVFEASANY